MEGGRYKLLCITLFAVTPGLVEVRAAERVTEAMRDEDNNEDDSDEDGDEDDDVDDDDVGDDDSDGEEGEEGRSLCRSSPASSPCLLLLVRVVDEATHPFLNIFTLLSFETSIVKVYISAVLFIGGDIGYVKLVGYFLLSLFVTKLYTFSQ